MAGLLRSIAALSVQGVRSLHTLDVGARLAESQRVLDELNAGTLPYTVTTYPGVVVYGSTPAHPASPGDGPAPAG